MVGPRGWLPSKCDQSKRSRDRRFHPGLGYRTTSRLRAHSLPARRWPAADVHQQIRRPVGFGQFDTISALVGLIWPVLDNLSFDVGLRHAITHRHRVNEVRAGLTFGFPLRMFGDRHEPK